MKSGTIGLLAEPVLVAIAVLLWGCAAAQGSDTLTLDYKISGAVQDSGSLSHAGDAAHLCSAAALPALHATVAGQAVEAPPGPPVYAVDYDSRAPAARPGIYLKAFAYRPGLLTHSDPADDWIQINAKGVLWAGHGSQSNWSDSFTFAADGFSGRVTARGLLPRNADGAIAPGQGIDIDVSWTCPKPEARP